MTDSLTPNLVVANPVVRKIANIVLGVASIVVSAAVVFDGSAPEFEWSSWTGPTSALVLFLAGVFQIAVTTPNVPTRTLPEPVVKAVEDYEEDVHGK